MQNGPLAFMIWLWRLTSPTSFSIGKCHSFLKYPLRVLIVVFQDNRRFLSPPLPTGPHQTSRKFFDVVKNNKCFLISVQLHACVTLTRHTRGERTSLWWRVTSPNYPVTDGGCYLGVILNNPLSLARGWQTVCKSLGPGLNVIKCDGGGSAFYGKC